MGTALVSSLLEIHGFSTLARIFLALAAAVAVSIVVGWLVFRTPKFVASVMPAWGMVSMGVISLGTAATTILGDSWWWFHTAFWILGTILGLVTYVVYARQIFTGNAGAPTFSWGLPLVPPMVSASSGMQVHGWLASINSASGYAGVVFWISLINFMLALVLAPAVFARVYFVFFSPAARRRKDHQAHLLGAPTAWIPLGFLGQSSFASYLLGRAASAGDPTHGWAVTTLVYSTAACILGIAVAGVAFVLHSRAVFGGISFSPSWWASTFPVGTFSLGTHALSLALGWQWLDIVSLTLLIVMFAHVLLAVLGGALAVMEKVRR